MPLTARAGAADWSCGWDNRTLPFARRTINCFGCQGILQALTVDTDQVIIKSTLPDGCGRTTSRMPAPGWRPAPLHIVEFA
jgi:hypothetical protein